MIRALYLCSLAFFCMGLAGCSQNFKNVSATFKSTFLSSEQTPISPETVRQLPYASLLAKLGDNPPALLILTWRENSKTATPIEKWVSADRELIATQNGRIIKTVNFKQGNLTDLQSSLPDPISLGILNEDTPKEWHYQISWQPGYHADYQAVSHFQIGAIETKQLLTSQRKLRHVIEQVTIPLINQYYQNDYWIDPASGQIQVSEQYLYPGSKKIHLAIAKPYLGGR